MKGSYLKKHCHSHFLELSNYPDFPLSGLASVPTCPDNRRSTVYHLFLSTSSLQYLSRLQIRTCNVSCLSHASSTHPCHQLSIERMKTAESNRLFNAIAGRRLQAVCGLSSDRRLYGDFCLSNPA